MSYAVLVYLRAATFCIDLCVYTDNLRSRFVTTHDKVDLYVVM
jgi:hypothetical protein